MGWTRWRKIAESNQWFDEHFDYEGPACYELGTGGPRGGAIQIHYVGETKSERSRIQCYARKRVAFVTCYRLAFEKRLVSLL